MNISSIWGQQVIFAVERCSGATGSHVTRSDVSHVTESDVSYVTGRDPVRKYVLRMRNRKLRYIYPNRAF
jgi:hypothetical protein